MYTYIQQFVSTHAHKHIYIYIYIYIHYFSSFIISICCISHVYIWKTHNTNTQMQIEAGTVVSDTNVLLIPDSVLRPEERDTILTILTIIC